MNPEQPDFKKFTLLEQTDTVASDSTQPKEDKDWKEKLKSESRVYISLESKLGWIDSNVIQPLQSQNEALQKEVVEYSRNLKNAVDIGSEYVNEIYQLQKENAELKEENLKLLKEIERLFVSHGEETTYQVMKSAIKNKK